MKPRSSDDLPRTLWLAALALTVVACSSVRMPDYPDAVHLANADKVVHFFLFGLLATLAARIPWMQRRRPFGIYAAIFFASCFGATDEWHQYFTPGRSCDVWDWVTDTAGAAVAVVVYAHWRTYRDILEWRIFGRGKRRVEIAPDACLIGADGFRRGPETDRRPAFADRAS
jgi:VanZ family protein